MAVRPSKKERMKHIGLFEGIGGFSIAARQMGWETIAWREWNPFGQQVLSYHFPNANKHGDITKTDFTIYRGKCDVLTGGFPCQPYSLAGKRKGKEDERHLWPEMLRAIREIQPRWIVGENVYGLINWGKGMVLTEIKNELEIAGYKTLPPIILPACAKDADHRRDRVWIIAYSRSEFEHCTIFPEVNGTKIQRQRRKAEWSQNREFVEVASCISSVLSKRMDTPDITGLLNEFSAGLDVETISEEDWIRESIKAYGNAIYNDIAVEIFSVIEEMEERLKRGRRRQKNKRQ